MQIFLSAPGCQTCMCKRSIRIWAWNFIFRNKNLPQ